MGPKPYFAKADDARRYPMENKAFYITTPIYYVNDLPHIGHSYTTIACDVMARYKRLAGFDVYFLTGTDEHGQKIERMAESKGVDPKQYCDGIAGAFRKLWERLDISNDGFIRTTDDEHVARVQKIFRKIYDNGDIYKGKYEGWYCTPCESFWPEGQLVNGNCPDCGRKVEWTEEEAYFFRLSKYADRLLKLYEDNPNFIQPATRKNEMVAFIKGGLEDLCVSRTTFKWGIQVDFDPGHVVYVWIDALSNYITKLGFPDEAGGLFARYWPADFHVVGKEIVRFHSVIWPALLMSMGVELPKSVFGHGWWTAEGEKISKSKGNMIDPGQYIDEFGSDQIRYFVLREISFGQDGDFSRLNFLHRTNAELANDLGNLLSRATAMIGKFFDGFVPIQGEFADIDREFEPLAAEVLENYKAAMDQMDFQGAFAEALRLVGRANKYIDETAPWVLAKDDSGKARLGTVLYNVAETCRVASILFSPVLTKGAPQIWRQLGLDGTPQEAGLAAAKWGGLVPGTEVRRGEPVYPRIDVKAVLDKDAAEKKAKLEEEIRQKAIPAAKKAESAAPAPNPDEPMPLIAIDDFAKIELRTAEVVAAERIEGSDKLLKLQVSVGGKPRQIVAGIAKHYKPEELVGKFIVIVANLQPAKLRGNVSEGMLLAASTPDHSELAVLTIDRPVPSGSRAK